MATQSLYRRYRPRRFSELKGQDHIVRALRTSVAEGREGQAYLFSGPRGTGKTTSARILAKVLNCQNPQDGEPCCECDSCLSVERGTSYDVHELDAASNNGVDAMRDLIEKAALGTPGRHKVYILDEVHMLSKGAEAALLKTLEEPPPHVVFVLATTDPQKMSDTIRSRTQHLQFHLLGADTLQEHVRWVAADAGLTVSDEAIDQVIAQGAGSPRDTLSALELIASTGGVATESISLDEFVEAMIENDPGRALTTVAQAISLGRDPRTVTEELIRLLRNGFLSLMAPDLVQLPSQHIGALIELSQRLGAAGLVRGIEHLGAALTEMRQAPDPRVLLDVAIVQLTSEQVSTDVAALAARLQRLERLVAEGAGRTPSAAPTASAGAHPSASDAPPPDANSPGGRRQLGARAGASTPAATAPTAPTATATGPTDTPADDAGPTDGELRVVESTSTAPGAAANFGSDDWDAVRPALRGIVKAVFAPAVFVSSTAEVVVLGLPNDIHRSKCEQHREAVEHAIAARRGFGGRVDLVVHGGGTDGPGGGATSGGDGRDSRHLSVVHDQDTDADPADVTEPQPRPPTVDAAPSEENSVDAGTAAPMSGRQIAEQARTRGPEPDPDEPYQVPTEALPDDDDVDLDELTDAPPEMVRTPLDRLAEAFPGSELVDDAY